MDRADWTRGSDAAAAGAAGWARREMQGQAQLGGAMAGHSKWAGRGEAAS
jgi:hypothetical protein